jgi:hypothetical protein
VTNPDFLVTVVAILLFVVERYTGRKDLATLISTSASQLADLVARADKERATLMAEFSRERGELLTRVQHPDVIIAPPAPGAPAVEEAELDEFDLVGTVQPAPLPLDEGPGPDAA